MRLSTAPYHLHPSMILKNEDTVLLINTCFRILYALLAGTWSDRHGRKTLLFLSVLGQLLASVSYGLNYWFLTQLSWHFLFLELINDLCGTYVSYYIAEYSFIMDVSDPSQRLL